MCPIHCADMYPSLGGPMQSDSKRNPDRDALSGSAPECAGGWFPDSVPRISGVVFWTWRIREGIWSLSSEFDRLLQVREPERHKAATDEWWFSRVHEEDTAVLIQDKNDLLENRITSFDVLFRLYRDDDCWVWCNSKGEVSERDEKGPVVISGITTNISWLRTNSKFQQDGAGVGDTTYHAMLENSPDLYVRMDRELFPLYMNPIVTRYMGREREEFFYDDSLDELKMESEHLAFLQRSVRKVFEEGVTVREITTFKAHDGEEVTGEYSFWPEYDATGRVTTAMTHFRDLTEQAKAEQSARLNERRLSALHELTQMEEGPDDEVLEFVLDSLLNLTSSGSGFIFLPDGDDLRGAGSMLWSRDHYGHIDAGSLAAGMFPPDLFALVTDENGGFAFPSIRNGDGRNPVHISFGGSMSIMRSMIAAEFEGDRPVLVVGVCNKNSDYVDADLKQLQMFINGAWLRLRRRLLVSELRKAKEAAEEANKAKSSFLANISHELRTPLNGMLSMLQLLDIDRLESEQGEYVKAALFSGNTLVRIISDILDLSRMETGQMELTPEVFDLKRSLAVTLRIFQDEAQQRDLGFAVDIDPAIPEALYGDDARVRQIVFNLVGNALKFTDAGGITVHCSLLRTAEDGATVYIGVSDTGIGIPPDQQGRIFDPFTQVDNSTTRRYPGTGLGLSIVKRLVSLMNGSATVESEPGRGTTIHCTLVFAPAPAGTLSLSGAAAPACGGRDGMDILVAEDDTVSAFAIRAFLKRCGHRVVCVPNGRKALEALQLHRFDCVFTDIQMPDMDGVEVAERIRRGRAEETLPGPDTRELLLEVFSAEEVGAVVPDQGIPIVAVTAHAMAGDRERFLRGGITDYISKPIAVEQLNRVLGRLPGI